MKTILVTSDITYCPDNYTNVLESVLEHSRAHIAGLVIITISPWRILKNIAYLWWAGCPQTQQTLRRNYGESRKNIKEQLFTDHDLPVLYASNIKETRVLDWLNARNADLIVNMRSRCLYGEPVLNAGRFGCINVHHGLLPQQRGLFCDLFALANNTATGFTIHTMTERIDRGTILYQEAVAPNKHYQEYLSSVAQAESVALSNVINTIAVNDCLPFGQPNQCARPTITTTPHWKDLQRFQQHGMIL